MPARRDEALVAAAKPAKSAAHAAGQKKPRSKSKSGAATAPAKRSRAGLMASLAFAAAVAGSLFYGWLNSHHGHLNPESGLGYWLGIAGASAMLLLLGYPLRKRMTSLKILGSVSGWFRILMSLGVIGPALILLHANFKLGSLNSNVALLAMLTVAGSGLVGRYLFSRIHPGLYRRRAQIGKLHADVKKVLTLNFAVVNKTAALVFYDVRTSGPAAMAAMQRTRNPARRPGTVSTATGQATSTKTRWAQNARAVTARRAGGA
jgi:hypothetical protein